MRPSPPSAPSIAGGSAPRTAPFAIRALTTVEEFAQCVELQRAVWGWTDRDLMPVRVFVLMQHVGGLVLAACDGAELVGFVNCVPGVRDGRTYWHSHMMGVLPSHQNRGVGTALKLAQRQHAVERGVSAIEWVFDPLQAKNAYLNITKLGAVVRRYSVNHYGASSSPLHAGLDSDRVVAEWRPGGLPMRCDTDLRTLAIPSDLQSLKAIDRPAVRRLQLAVRAAFLDRVAEGFVACGFERGAGCSRYVFRRPADAEGAHRADGG